MNKDKNCEYLNFGMRPQFLPQQVCRHSVFSMRSARFCAK